jgi:hypothetical protein
MLELSTPRVFVVAPRFVSLLIALFALRDLCVLENDLRNGRTEEKEFN